MLNIKYDIVGSFLRPEPIKKARAEYAQGKITLEELRKVEDVAIADLVSKEVAHGLKIVTDGEFRPALVASGLAQGVRWIYHRASG